ncbi:MAG: hypothetical protein WBA54_02120 [Acidaminobacteraceae bacterium]
MKILNNYFNKNSVANQDKTNNLFEKPKVAGSSLDQIINSSSVKPENGLRDALRELKNENVKIDNMTVKEVNNFLKNASGTLDSKLETVSYAAKKGVDITEKNLTAMQNALNDSVNNAELIQTLSATKESDLTGEKAVKKIDEMNLPEDIKEKLKGEISNNKTLKEAIASVVSDTLKMEVNIKDGLAIVKTDDNDRFMNLKDMVKLLESVSKILDKFGEKGLDIIKDLLSSQLSGQKILVSLNFIENSDMSLEQIKAEVDKLIEVESLDSKEDLNVESKVADNTNEVDKNIDVIKVSDSEDKSVESLASSLEVEDIPAAMLDRLEGMLSDINAEIEDENMILDELTSLIEGGGNFKFFVVKEITEKIIEVKSEFVNFQKDIRNTIDDVLIEPGKTKEVSKDEIVELIAKATQKLDDVIMKSDITLYTSMKGERDLVKMSSDLADARNMIGKGNIKGALDVIKSVRTKIENMKFNPSLTKVEGHLKDKADSLIDLNNQNYAFSKTDITPSGRGVLELMRSLGLNHEYEVSEKLQHNLLKEDSSLKDNVKMALLKMMQDSKDSKTVVEGVEKSLNNLTGQQLLNRNNPNSEKQSLMFNIPIETPTEVKNLKLYVNGREKANALDWENCSLYFVIETKNYGMTGVKIDISDRSVNLTIRNDDDKIKKVAEPLVDDVLNEFTEIGLKKGVVNFRKLNLDKDNKANVKEVEDSSKYEIENKANAAKEAKKTMEGFDFKI